MNFTKQNDEKIIIGNNSNVLVEGYVDYTGPGVSLVQDTCPGYHIQNPYTGECEKVCKNCKVSDKSFEFNEYDPCFPNGVYDGINNNGDVMCTCGSRGQYCNEQIKIIYLQQMEIL